MPHNHPSSNQNSPDEIVGELGLQELEILTDRQAEAITGGLFGTALYNTFLLRCTTWLRPIGFMMVNTIGGWFKS